MANIKSSDDVFNFQKQIYSRDERLITEEEVYSSNYIKIKLSENITITEEPKVLALDGADGLLSTGKIFTNIESDVAIGVITKSANVDDIVFAQAKGVVNDPSLIGLSNSPVYVDAAGKMTLQYSFCKIGVLLKNGVVFLNIGNSSSDNNSKLTADFLKRSETIPGIIQMLGYDLPFMEVNPPLGEESNYYYSLIYANEKLLAVGPEGTKRVIYSDDFGLTWDSAQASNMSSWKSVAYGNGIYVAVAQSGTVKIMTSPNGIDWTNQTEPVVAEWKSIAYGNGRFFAVAAIGNKQIMSSVDGIMWTTYTYISKEWNSIAFGNGFFIASSDDGSLLKITTDDPNDWTIINGGGSAKRVIFSGDLFWLSNSDYSSDGINWINYGLVDQTDFFELKNNYKTYVGRIMLPDTIKLTVSNIMGKTITFPGSNITCAASLDNGAVIVLTGGTSNKYYRSFYL